MLLDRLDQRVARAVLGPDDARPRRARSTPSPAAGPGFYLNVTYTYCVLFAGLVILVDPGDPVAVPLSQAHGDPGARPPCVPWLGNLIFVTRSEAAGTIDSTPFLFTCTAVIAAVAVFRYRVLEPIPTLLDARIEVIGDGFLIVDRSLPRRRLEPRGGSHHRARPRHRRRRARSSASCPTGRRTSTAKCGRTSRWPAPDGARIYDVRITPIQSRGERAHRLRRAAARRHRPPAAPKRRCATASCAIASWSRTPAT